MGWARRTAVGTALAALAVAVGPGAGGAQGGRAAPTPIPAAATAAAAGSRPGEPAPAGRPAAPPAGASCRDDGVLCAGAAKAAITPAQRHVDGVDEPRLGVGMRRQRFHLGGFGINPLQSTPDPTGEVAAALTLPAEVRRFAGSHGPEDLWLRVLVLTEGSGPSFAVVTLDAIGAGNVVQGRLTQVVAQATGLRPSDVLVASTHTHAGPDLQGLWGGVPQDWLESVLYPAAGDAARRATRARTPVELDVRHGPVPQHNRYRRPKRLDPAITSDPVATLVQARHQDGSVVASLLQFTAHPTSVDEDPRAPHPDYVLGALDLLEQRSGGTALYVNGPIADASPAGVRAGCAYPADGTYGTVRCRGEGIADAVLSFPVDRILRTGLVVRHADVLLPVTNPLFLAAGAAGAFNRYYDFLELPTGDLPVVGPVAEEAQLALPQLTPTARAQVSRITIGGPSGLELVTIPGETTGTFADGIRALAPPGAHVVPLGLTHGSFGYILPEEEFSLVDLSGDAGFLLPYTPYEELVSLGPLTATLLRAVGYAPLFGASAEQALPPVVAACLRDPERLPCAIPVVRSHLAYGLRELADDVAP